jgi:uncharacterized integral membrane protein (TIGR00701 family)
MLWLKAFHIIFVVCWFAGLFYLPRIFVYYAASEQQAVREQLAVMARKLYRFVTPFMVIAVALGIVMIAMNPDYYLAARWMWLKLGGVACLIVYHIICSGTLPLRHRDPGDSEALLRALDISRYSIDNFDPASTPRERIFPRIGQP